MGEAVNFYCCWSGQENLIGPNPDRFECFGFFFFFPLRKSLKCTTLLDVSFGGHYRQREFAIGI